MMKKEPTHFIEQYNGMFTKNVNFTKVISIYFLEKHLLETKHFNSIKTVAIFKIYKNEKRN